VRGVIDSEDLPLSISREKPQDGALLRKVSTVVTRKLLRFLDERSRKDADKYKEFWNEYGHFLKEGACQDLANQAAIAKLLRFESSSTETGEWVSFDEYVTCRCYCCCCYYARVLQLLIPPPLQQQLLLLLLLLLLPLCTTIIITHSLTSPLSGTSPAWPPSRRTSTT
jgi:hypothetical protein